MKVCLYNDSNPPPVIALAVRFTLFHAAPGTDDPVLTVWKKGCKNGQWCWYIFLLAPAALRRDKFNFEVKHKIVPDILGGGLGLFAPGVEHVEYRFHWTGV